jgi:hypothetical protein
MFNDIRKQTFVILYSLVSPVATILYLHQSWDTSFKQRTIMRVPCFVNRANTRV